MQTDFRSFGQSGIRQQRRLCSLVLTLALALLLGNLQLASASSVELEPAADVSADRPQQETDEPAARALAEAMGVPRDDIVSASLMGSDPRSAAVFTTTLGTAGFPTEGASYAVLATGIAEDAKRPNDSPNHTTILDGLNNSQGQDLVRLHLKLKVPGKNNCLAFDFVYYSEEFEEYVGNIYNDTFSAQLNRSDLPISDNTVEAPGNFAFDTEQSIVSVNTSFGVTTTQGTTYDGRTPRLRAQAEVVRESEIDLYLSIQDLGDSQWDSAVFLDNFFWSQSAECDEGAVEDTDGDGLLDIWETEGLTVTVDGVTDFVDLPKMGAHPQRKDIFVEIDYMVEYSGTEVLHTHKPLADAIADVVTAFANAPVTNTDGTTGIRLHVDYGGDAPLTYNDAVPQWGALSRSNELTHTNVIAPEADNGFTWAAFDEIKEANFTVGREAVFHYNMWIHRLLANKGTSGRSRGTIGGASDFIVSLGAWTNRVGSRREQAGTFMHELGHNLGLHHGGADGTNYKPNYLSVMSYAFQTDGLIINQSQGNMDYSRFVLADLKENSLNEPIGVITKTVEVSIANSITRTYGTYWYCSAKGRVIQSTNSADAVDWNCNGVSTDNNVSESVNDDRRSDGTLSSQNDWDQLIYTGGSIGLPGADIVLPDVIELDEITEEEANQIPALYPEILIAKPQTVETWTRQATFEGHVAPVEGVAWSPDGSRFATASDDATVRVWDATTGEQLLVLEGHGANVYSVAWSPDGSLLASGSEDATVHIWDADTGEQVGELQGGSPVRSVAWSPVDNRIAVGSGDGAVRLWDGSGDSTMLAGHTAEVNSVAWSPDGSELASGSSDLTVRVWNIAAGEALNIFEGHTDRVTSVAWSPDGHRLASGSFDGTVHIWDMAFDAYLATLSGHGDGVMSVAWSPDGVQLASGSMDTTIQIWDAASEQRVTTLEGAAGPIYSVAWSPDGVRLLSGTANAAVELWGRAVFAVRDQWDVRTEMAGAGVAILSAAWSPTDSRIAYGAGDGVLRIWDTETNEVVTIFDEHTDGIRGVAWSPDGSQVASASYDRTVRVWDAATGENLAVLEGHAAGVTSVAWSLDGSRLASGAGTGDSSVRVWDVASGETVNTLQGHAEEVSGVAWSPDGSRIASASMDKTLRVWNADTGDSLRTIDGHTDAVTSVAWSPDGSQLASGSVDNTVRVWDTVTGENQGVYEGHTETVFSVAWAPDSNRLASGAGDATLRVWDTTAGENLIALDGHADAVRGVTWSPAGDLLASGSNDGTVRVWNAEAERISLTPAGSAGATGVTLPRIQAESGTYQGGATSSDIHGGFDGAGFAAYLTTVGTAVSLEANAPSTGSYDLNIRYAAGPDGPDTDRTMSLYVNGSKIGQITFERTGDWATWADQSAIIDLNSGDNTIEFRFDSGDTGYINIDYVEASSGG